MLLTISTTHRPATDLGYLLHKHPGRVQDFDLPFGTARVFYPEASEERCTAALLLEVDPVELARGRAGQGALEHYVNDRPYAVNSFLSVAIARVFGTALGGRSKERQELAERPIPLRAELPAVPVRGWGGLVEELFSPLGYGVTAERLPLDPEVPSWGDSPYHRVRIEGEHRVRDLLRHLYVLIPVLDDRKHYWVGQAEVEKLLHRGEGWLQEHPERERIVGRYLKHRRPLTRHALDRLTEGEGQDPDERREAQDAEELRLERPIRLHDERLERVCAELEALGARRVVDLGCGSGKLIRRLLRSGTFETILGVDVSLRALETAHRRLHLEDAAPGLRKRVELLHGSLTYVDPRLEGFDAAALVEVIEHLDRERLAAAERVVWGHARPGAVLVTTPNRDYNARFENLPAGGLRHADHRFEWSREEFREWAAGVAERFGYEVVLAGIGPEVRSSARGSGPIAGTSTAPSTSWGMSTAASTSSGPSSRSWAGRWSRARRARARTALAIASPTRRGGSSSSWATWWTGGRTRPGCSAWSWTPWPPVRPSACRATTTSSWSRPSGASA